jgi:hypothetical protein
LRNIAIEQSDIQNRAARRVIVSLSQAEAKPLDAPAEKHRLTLAN